MLAFPLTKNFKIKLEKIIKLIQKKNPQFQNLLEKELFISFIHGILHLLGCDHQKESEKQLIFSLQEKVLDF